jgi:hypothetical protein
MPKVTRRTGTVVQGLERYRKPLTNEFSEPFGGIILFSMFDRPSPPTCTWLSAILSISSCSAAMRP